MLGYFERDFLWHQEKMCQNITEQRKHDESTSHVRWHSRKIGGKADTLQQSLSCGDVPLWTATSSNIRPVESYQPEFYYCARRKSSKCHKIYADYSFNGLTNTWCLHRSYVLWLSYLIIRHIHTYVNNKICGSCVKRWELKNRAPFKIRNLKGTDHVTSLNIHTTFVSNQWTFPMTGLAWRFPVVQHRRKTQDMGWI